MFEASAFFVAGISFVLILVTLLSGMWIFVGIGVTGLICAMLFQGELTGMIYVPFDTTNSFTMTAALTFIFMGEIILRSGISMQFFRGAAALLRFLPGCLYHSVVAASAIFAATSGSSVASAATIGRIAMPELLARKYHKNMSLGVICAGSTLASLIPPSVGLIIYGSCTHDSVTRLFIGTVIPGVMIALMFMVYIGIRVTFSKKLVPVKSKQSIGQTLKDAIHVVPISIIIVLLLGSLYRGIATPTEAGTVGAIAAIVLAACYRRLSVKMIVDSLIGSVQITSMLMLLIMVGYMLGGVYGALKIPKLLVEWVAEAQIRPVTVIVAIVVFYTIMGLFLETIPVFVISIGTIYPLITGLGYDGVWFGIFSAIILVAGMITPPVGLSLYVVQAIPPGYKMGEVMRGTIPFLVILYIAAALLLIFPELVLWLPSRIVGQ
jgi:tripartite ATP-independent transporter DctM subunit